MENNRKMPFGKYKDTLISELIKEHPFYMKWVRENTNFQLSEDEKKAIDEEIDLRKLLARGNWLISNIHQHYISSGVNNEARKMRERLPRYSTSR